MRAETPYVRLLGKHRFIPNRFLLQDEDSRWYLWFGDRPGRPLEPIDNDLMAWVTSELSPHLQPTGRHDDPLAGEPLRHPRATGGMEGRLWPRAGDDGLTSRPPGRHRLEEPGRRQGRRDVRLV